MIEAISTLSSALIKAKPDLASQAISSTANSSTAVSGFGEMMSQLASETVTSLKAGEAASIAGVQGKASAQQVVESVLAAERSLQTAIAIRDKFVSAFQDLNHMSI